ncbi:AAA family ATPase [Methylomonas sp. HYX-M1]|uniref:AAA family ATPase n=1 Tax=Methylomonas sp. HYX-M1 TaxID=3139307 RepID=UPI00345C4378
MRITNLQLEGFRCFERYEINLSNRFTLLIGDNGSGKTAVLDALRKSLVPFLHNLPDFSGVLISEKQGENSNPTIDTSDVHYKLLTSGQTAIKETTSPTSILITISIDSISNPLNSKLTNKSSFFNENKIPMDLPFYALQLKIDNENTRLPIISYYGTGRLWKLINEEEKQIKTLSPGSRLLGYRDCLNSESNLKILFRWFKTQELAALQKNETRHVLEAVRIAIVEMIPGGKQAWWDIDWDEILIETEILGKTQTIPFHLLSDGYRNMIGMVADIAYRMATLNPQLEADVIKQTEGIVLIDEIDLHLHPKWQREVVGRLLNTFPKVQFVASSHSPFIIQSLYGREDCLLWDLEKAQPIAIESESIEDIAEEQQHVEIPQKSKRYLDMMDAAEAYYRKLHEVKNESDMEVMQLRSKLDELSIPFSDDPAFAAQLKFERDSVLASKDK